MDTVVIFRLFEEKPPTVPIKTKICVVDSLPYTMTCAKLQVQIFTGYDFTGCRISHFLIDFCIGLTMRCV